MSPPSTWARSTSCPVAPRIGETGGIPVGLMAAATYEEHVVTFSRGDRLSFCTAGIIESDNQSQEEFGVARLLDALTASPGSSVAETVSSLMDEVEKWTKPNYPEDDASILAIERLPDSK